MPQFLINANEAITSRHPYAELNEFARGYVEAMFFTNGDCGDDNEDLLNELGVDALTHESTGFIERYCHRFEFTNATALEAAYSGDYDAAQAGRDLWFTAQGHGCGFWDRDQIAVAPRALLTEAAKRAGEAYVEVSGETPCDGCDDVREIFWRQ